ncbi:hypothetical protein G7K_4464-t1 [Saitoella complicata NRRL Y-17804]|uniref:Uncharacterized protein n=1 Tax=Saitoella complicata (strain BCRC 22490 / CBS 7301 / JCM 7358 / NBRC 10748 / NRRL Y-17804) TaxID=698492 RepID=A0A0E9NKV7_SAICN|nr:hypothetical protein G7K_4464-t1 [Saitoella complicata NRRL Y-17804]
MSFNMMMLYAQTCTAVHGKSDATDDLRTPINCWESELSIANFTLRADETRICQEYCTELYVRSFRLSVESVLWRQYLKSRPHLTAESGILLRYIGKGWKNKTAWTRPAEDMQQRKNGVLHAFLAYFKAGQEAGIDATQEELEEVRENEYDAEQPELDFQEGEEVPIEEQLARLELEEDAGEG